MNSNRKHYSFISAVSLAVILSSSVFANAYAVSPLGSQLAQLSFPTEGDSSTSVDANPGSGIQQDQNKDKDKGNHGKGNNSTSSKGNSGKGNNDDDKEKGNSGKGNNDKQNDNGNKGKGKKVKIKADSGEGGKVKVAEEGEDDDSSDSDDQAPSAATSATEDDEESQTFPADFLLEADGGIAVEKGQGKRDASSQVHDDVSLSLDVTTIRVEGNHLRVSLDGEISLGDAEYEISDGKGIIIFFKNPGKNFFRGIIHITGTAINSEDDDESAKLHLRAILLPPGDNENSEGTWKFVVAPAAKLGPKLRIISLIGVLEQLDGNGGNGGGQPPANQRLDHFVISNIQSSVEVGKLFNVTVTAVNSEGKTVKNYLGNARVSDLSGTVKPELLVGFKEGVFSGKLNITEATKSDKLTVTDVPTGKKGTSNTFDVVAGPINKIDLAPSSATIQPGQKASFTATLLDKFGNEISPSGKSFAWSLSSADFGSIATSLNKANFTASSSVTVERNVTLTVRVNITASAFVDDASKITISPTAQQALDHFAVGQVSSPKTAGVTFPLSLTAVGTNGQTVISFTGTIVLDDTTGTLQIVTNNGFSNGVWSGTVKITKASSDVKITVKDSDSPSKTGSSNLFDVKASDIDHFGVTGIGNTQVAGQEFPFNVTAIDAFGNIVKDYNGTVTLSTNDGTSPAGNATVLSPSPYAFISLDEGRHEFSATLYNAKANVTITVTGSGKEDTSNKFTVQPGAVAEIIMTPDAISVTPGTNVTLTAEAKDASGNTITPTGDTFAWSLSSSSLGSLNSTSGSVVKFMATTDSITEPLAGSVTVTSGSVSRSVNITITPSA